MSDRTLDASNVYDLYSLGALNNSDPGSYLDTTKNLSSYLYNSPKIIFTKDVLIEKVVIKNQDNYNSGMTGAIIGINADNSSQKIADISSQTNQVTITNPTKKKYRGVQITGNGYGRYDVFLERGSYIYRELVLKKQVGTQEVLYMFVLEDYGDKHFLYMSPLKKFDESKRAVFDRYDQIGIMQEMAILSLENKANDYYISLQDRRICGAFSSQSGDNVTWQPFYIGLVRPYGRMSHDPFLCFASGVSRASVLASKENVSFPYAKIGTEYKQCITHPYYPLLPTNNAIDNLSGDFGEPFAMPLIVCYFNGRDKWSTMKGVAESLFWGNYENIESKLLGDMDGIIALILGKGVSVGDDVLLDEHNYKIITAGNDLTSPYCYAIIKE